MGEHSLPELPEAPASWRKYTKGVVAVAGGLAAAVTPIAMGDGNVSVVEIVQAVINLLTALGVISFANKGVKG
jgi:hypothetical protein